MNEPKATRYQRRQRQARVGAWTLAGLALAGVAFTPAGRWLHQATVQLVAPLPPSAQFTASLILFLVLVAAWCELAVVPAVVYRSHRAEQAYGRSGAGTVVGRLVGFLALLPVVVVAGLLVHVAGRIAGAAWWLVAGLVLSMALVAVVRVGPLILGRLGGVRPLARPDLAARIAELSRRSGVAVAAIQEWQVDETSSTVAMVAGMGRGRRVLVASDVARDWSDDEVSVVVAHELAHHVHRDLLRSFALNAAVLCVGLLAAQLLMWWGTGWFGVTGAADPVALPVIAFAVLMVWLAATPLRHAQSRRQERRADRFALASTGQADAFATAIRRASARHMADERPTPLTRWLFYRHPSVAERLALAERFLRDRANG